MWQLFPRWTNVFFKLPRRARRRVFRAWLSVSNVALAIEVAVILLFVVALPWMVVRTFLDSANYGASEEAFWIVTVLFVLWWLVLMTIYIAADLASVVHDMKDKGQCLDCGYDLRGSLGADCPECGARRLDMSM